MAPCHNLGELKSTRQAPLWHRASALISPRLSGHPQHQEWAPCPHDPGQYRNRHQKGGKKAQVLGSALTTLYIHAQRKAVAHINPRGEKKRSIIESRTHVDIITALEYTHMQEHTEQFQGSGHEITYSLFLICISNHAHTHTQSKCVFFFLSVGERRACHEVIHQA